MANRLSVADVIAELEKYPRGAMVYYFDGEWGWQPVETVKMVDRTDHMNDDDDLPGVGIT